MKISSYLTISESAKLHLEGGGGVMMILILFMMVSLSICYIIVGNVLPLGAISILLHSWTKVSPFFLILAV